MPKPTFHKDVTNKTITVEILFQAPRTRVWEAWTTSELLEKWWAPKPWMAVTKSFDFREGGHWHYCMQGPSGEKAWCWVGYKTINAENSFTAEDTFCDEEGKPNASMPSMQWHNAFQETSDGSKVIVTIQFASVEDMEKIIGMGFEAGFTMGLNNLTELLTA